MYLRASSLGSVVACLDQHKPKLEFHQPRASVSHIGGDIEVTSRRIAGSASVYNYPTVNSYYPHSHELRRGAKVPCSVTPTEESTDLENNLLPRSCRDFFKRLWSKPSVAGVVHYPWICLYQSSTSSDLDQSATITSHKLPIGYLPV